MYNIVSDITNHEFEVKISNLDFHNGGLQKFNIIN